jgi:DNA-binding protein Fis
MAERTVEERRQTQHLAHSVIAGAVLEFDLASRASPSEQLRKVQLESMISDHIRRVLNACAGNVSLAAELLAVNRRTLQRALQGQNNHWQVRRGTPKPWAPDRKSTVKRRIDPVMVAALREKNMTWKQIGAELNCTDKAARLCYLRFISGR